MIITGIVFVSVMDGMTLFGRYARLKTEQVADNMRLVDGYRHLRDLTAFSDSVSAESGDIRLFRKGASIAVLSESGTLLIAERNGMMDTLMTDVSSLTLIERDRRTAADTITLTVGKQGDATLDMSFAITTPMNELVVRQLEEREKPHLYE